MFLGRVRWLQTLCLGINARGTDNLGRLSGSRVSRAQVSRAGLTSLGAAEVTEGAAALSAALGKVAEVADLACSLKCAGKASAGKDLYHEVNMVAACIMQCGTNRRCAGRCTMLHHSWGSGGDPAASAQPRVHVHHTMSLFCRF